MTTHLFRTITVTLGFAVTMACAIIAVVASVTAAGGVS